jgi:hypothetical protein
MKDEMVKGIQMEVYARYNPTQYKRRYGNGGLEDKNNMVSNVSVEGNRIYIDLENVTRGAGDNSYQRIDDIIVSGTGYTWRKSNIYKMQPYPRDFYDRTQRIIDQDGKIESLIFSQLKSRGYDIY